MQASLLWLFDNDFDGHIAVNYFATHTWVPAVATAAYLLFVRYGQQMMERRPPFLLLTASRCWNICIAIFSMCGSCVCVPHLYKQLTLHGFWYSVCADVYDLAGYGPPVVWAVAFVWSKMFEAVDTALLILKKKRVITLHWFHHASVICFTWSGFVYENPAALWFGSMNFFVHSIMYTYFALMSYPQLRDRVRRAAPIITALQIMQFAFGTVVNAFAAGAYLVPSVGCAIHPFILQLSGLLYLVYGGLFAHLFYKRYIRNTPTKPPLRTADQYQATLPDLESPSSCKAR